ncbi:MAG: CehA/McbA family metallohydrolase [Planctomycetales bacterium]|nr:CehA/McbA family metallohydrolase [Planctomycetales bacterium]
MILPRNTEYEVFSVDGKRHTLGAMFLLNHKSVFTAGAPPVGLIAAQAHGEGALIDLDKHSWPWSMMLVPIAKVDLYELSNNSVWRTEFGFKTSAVPWADYMSVETDGAGMTERGWLDFGFENYYTLLNCGFRLQPTAGTASGVHPVPLGYSRVYADVEGNFSSDAWLQALKVGRSFVTNGPMLIARANGKTHGHVFASDDSVTLQIDGEAWFDHPLAGVELIKNGRAEPVSAYSEETTNGVFRLRFSAPVTVEETSWIALRCFENRTDGRVRFAHTSPWHIEIGKQSIRPRKVEVAYLIERMKREIARSNGVLHDDAMAEFQKALEIYEAIASRAR